MVHEFKEFKTFYLLSFKEDMSGFPGEALCFESLMRNFYTQGFQQDMLYKCCEPTCQSSSVGGGNRTRTISRMFKQQK
jgi:hypothetical protein